MNRIILSFLLFFMVLYSLSVGVLNQRPQSLVEALSPQVWHITPRLVANIYGKYRNTRPNAGSKNSLCRLCALYSRVV